MRTTPTDSLEQRVSRLERANRRLRLLVSAALLGLAALLLMGQSGLNAIQAERFEVVDGEGNLRALLGIAQSGRTVLALYESEGEARFRRAAIWNPRPIAAGPDGEEIQPPPEDEAPIDRAGRSLRRFGQDIHGAIQSASGRVRNRDQEPPESVEEAEVTEEAETTEETEATEESTVTE
jgi:hypothetical protein